MGETDLNQSIENLREMIDGFSKAQTDAMLMALGANVMCFIEAIQRRPKQAREIQTNHLAYLKQLGISREWIDTVQKLFDTIVDRYEKLEEHLNKTARKLSSRGLSDEEVAEELRKQAAQFVLEH